MQHGTQWTRSRGKAKVVRSVKAASEHHKVTFAIRDSSSRTTSRKRYANSPTTYGLPVTLSRNSTSSGIAKSSKSHIIYSKFFSHSTQCCVSSKKNILRKICFVQASLCYLKVQPTCQTTEEIQN